MPHIAHQGEASSEGPAPSARQLTQVAVATLLVAGLPVAIVWWLRGSGTVSSAALGALIGMGLSLGLSRVACLVWESLPGSEDLLFSELMIWGYVNRWRTQRRLASARWLLGPMGENGSFVEGSTPKDPVELLERLVARMETRDPYLHGHSRRVARHSWMIARRMGLPRAQAARIRTAAALHDVGKINTPRKILHKAGGLTAAEFEVIKRHPTDGARMVDVLRDAELTAIVRHHHERLDGSGYPSGLSGEEIPLGARIIAVADSFDAITSTRPYRSARAHKQAIGILKEEAGIKLDREAVRAFCSHYAGRRPLALWSSVAGLPARVLSWLGESAAGVASAAKVVAVAALVGGAAVTSATLGMPAATSRAPVAHPATVVGSGSQIFDLTPVRAVLGPAATRLSFRVERVGRSALASSAHGGSPTPQTVARVAGATARAALQDATASSSPRHPGLRSRSTEQAPVPHKPEEARGPHKPEAAPGGGRPEQAPPKGKPEEAPVNGKPEEAPVKGRPEEAPGREAPEGAPGKGKPEEGPGKGKPEEGPGKGKPDEAPGRGKVGEASD